MQGPRPLDADLRRLAGDLPSPFHLDDSWATYDAFRPLADARYRSFGRLPLARWFDRLVAGPRS